MRFQRFFRWLLLIAFGLGAFSLPGLVRADERRPAPSGQVSAYDLIIAMNTLRVSNGLPALIEDPIINAVAQSTYGHLGMHEARYRLYEVEVERA